MNRRREREEHLEHLWCLKEEGDDTVDALKDALKADYDTEILDDLLSDGLVELSEGSDRIGLTEQGEEYARKVIRAHRLAERLLYDVLGGDYESGACEFEHTVTHELVDSICILLGHPRACPHGMSIPEGKCCKHAARTAQSAVLPLAGLEVGQSARVAYVNCKSDRQLHKMNSLYIRPGAVVTLHQRYPCYVVECEGCNIAMGDEIISSICVWREPDPRESTAQEDHTEAPGKRRRRRGFGHTKKRDLQKRRA